MIADKPTIVNRNHGEKGKELQINLVFHKGFESIGQKEHSSFFEHDQLGIFDHLLSLSQHFSYHIDTDIATIATAITNVTHGSVKMMLLPMKIRNTGNCPIEASSFCFPLQFHGFTYGALLVSPEVSYPDASELSLVMVSVLAQICSLLLNTLEQSALLQIKKSEMYLQSNQDTVLTEREKEILHLICHGHDQESIANRLCISNKTVKKHKNNIYKKLKVHSQQEAVMIAYVEGLFSPIEKHSQPKDICRYYSEIN
ncbi:response regulator transcription factor [Dictyobacter arantiisoli]|uniref:HTH luxR-type domain-containing protein n=1 Tax=Dictyobacter arantiisoli TaxID=2014874 RepID=A0A5A5TGT1_9CHLR|nr:response regulator transcription factor [Dictyobacter arantiisoli]GCF10366.1 hypothetical protein KDI_39300 [Dictyobacter arantiisoli]